MPSPLPTKAVHDVPKAVESPGLVFRHREGEDKELEQLIHAGAFESKLAVKILATHGTSHPHRDWIEKQMVLCEDTFQVIQQLSRFVHLAENCDAALKSDVGGIVFDNLMKSVATCRISMEKADVNRRGADETALALADPNPEDKVFTQNLTNIAAKVFRLPTLQDVVKGKRGSLYDSVFGGLLEIRHLANGFEFQSDGHWWKKIGKDNPSLEEILRVCTSTVGTIDGGVMKRKLDEINKARSKLAG